MGLRDVAADLLFQRIDGLEFSLFAQALQEDQFDLRLGQQLDFVEVEQVAISMAGESVEVGRRRDGVAGVKLLALIRRPVSGTPVVGTSSA